MRKSYEDVERKVETATPQRVAHTRDMLGDVAGKLPPELLGAGGVNAQDPGQVRGAAQRHPSLPSSSS